MNLTRVFLGLSILAICACDGGVAASVASDTADTTAAAHLIETHADTLAIDSIVARLDTLAVGDTARAVDTARYGSHDTVVTVARRAAGYDFKVQSNGGISFGCGLSAISAARSAWYNRLKGMAGEFRWIE